MGSHPTPLYRQHVNLRRDRDQHTLALGPADLQNEPPSWWSSVIGALLTEQIFAAGFSAGAYTTLLLAGARVAFSQFELDNPELSPVRGPREFPDLADELPKLYENPVFRMSWDRRRSDFSDPRIRAVFAIAPGRSVLGFSRESLQAIDRPAYLIGGDGENVAPPERCGEWLSQNIPRCSSENYGAAERYVPRSIEHRPHNGLNNRAENSHVPLRKQEWMMSASVPWAACDVSSWYFQQSEISSCRYIRNAQP